ncbi:hypothetical protein CERSUDRAFT_89666 [Gelatoporia subvermispora B]|uniref:Uncharacterized protein n=1 Tax=Ceriporiopsis subvermispora (strain B) TaxID=914234 RepID=M2QW98_CERS8|nr:hypothetical protein CERSUDRAFT_89666 [Gelatoporia subvermispora B]
MCRAEPCVRLSPPPESRAGVAREIDVCEADHCKSRSPAQLHPATPSYELPGTAGTQKPPKMCACAYRGTARPVRERNRRDLSSLKIDTAPAGDTLPRTYQNRRHRHSEIAKDLRVCTSRCRPTSAGVRDCRNV